MGCLKTGLKIAVGMALLGGLAIGLLLKFGMGSGEAALGEFFSAVSTETVAEVCERIHPNLAKEADPQVLAAFLKAVPARFGAFKSIQLNGFNFSKEIKNGQTHENYSGTCVFEKGELTLEMTFLDGKLLGFFVKKPREAAQELLAAASVVPPNTAPYGEYGLRFWKAALGGKAQDAFPMMAEVLQKQLGLQTFVRQISTMERFGALQSITLADPKVVDGQPNQLLMLYDCKFAKGDMKAHCKFVFADLKSHLIGFQIPSKE